MRKTRAAGPQFVENLCKLFRQPVFQDSSNIPW